MIRITAKRNNWSMENFKSLFKPKRIKTFLLMTFFPFVQGGYRTSECSFFLLRRFVFRLRHLHICHYSPYLPPKILHNLFFFISTGYYSRTKRNWKQCLCIAWEMCKLRIKRARDWWRIARNHGKEKEERRSGSRPFSPSRLLFPANFYRERERDRLRTRNRVHPS